MREAESEIASRIILFEKSLKGPFFLLSLTILLACSASENKIITLFNGLGFRLMDGETAADPDSLIIRKYTEYFNNQGIQIPLFKYVKNDQYEIFVGIPFNTSLEKLTRSRINYTGNRLAGLKYDSLFFYNRYTLNGLNISELASGFGTHSLIFISAISSEKTVPDSLFTISSLSGRINSKP